jgi:hypothetical protein
MHSALDEFPSEKAGNLPSEKAGTLPSRKAFACPPPDIYAGLDGLVAAQAARSTTRVKHRRLVAWRRVVRGGAVSCRAGANWATIRARPLIFAGGWLAAHRVTAVAFSFTVSAVVFLILGLWTGVAHSGGAPVVARAVRTRQVLPATASRAVTRIPPKKAETEVALPDTTKAPSAAAPATLAASAVVAAPTVVAAQPAVASPPLVAASRVITVPPPVAAPPTVATAPAASTRRQLAAQAAPAENRRQTNAGASGLVVITEPEGARVTINGVGWGSTPLRIPNLPPGTKRIRVTRLGYEGEERVLRANDVVGAATLRIVLREMQQGPR